jgi:hypothetical protein
MEIIMEDTSTSSTDSNVTVGFNKDEYAQYLEFVAHTRQRNVAAKVKDMGLRVTARRQTLVNRRVDTKAIAPDEDIAAYGEIYKLKNPTADAKQKTSVTDNEIKAYKVLDPDFKVAPALEILAIKVEDMIAAGDLTKDGDVADDDDTEG